MELYRAWISESSLRFDQNQPSTDAERTEERARSTVLRGLRSSEFGMQR